MTRLIKSPCSTPGPQLAKAKAEVARAQAEQKKAASDASRRRHLSQNFISAEDLENANTALNTATTNLEAAKAVVGVAQATLDHANGSSRRRK
ncbi:fusaric acid resistance protein fusE [Klebsiella michiganensis]|uniref:Fusaric acid resistance protein fusE n=1 Tax=Klebsiella michiganensis TaxID=1134687 RepID=A0A7H4PLR7_9ENTR|nr:fusaric acid resistance protein fusE [Klebsiella michiganensis]